MGDEHFEYHIDIITALSRRRKVLEHRGYECRHNIERQKRISLIGGSEVRIMLRSVRIQDASHRCESMTSRNWQ